jgi:membrane protease YdiL (CAAX protease family)
VVSAPLDGSTPADGEAARAWAPWTAPVALLGGLGAALVGGALLAIVGLVAGTSLSHPPPAINIAGLVVQDVGLVAVAVLFAGWVGRRPVASDFGLRKSEWLASRRLVVRRRAFMLPSGLVMAGVVVGGLAVTLLVTLVWTSLIGAHQPEHLPRDLGAESSLAARLAVAGAVAVVAPVCEEVFFRGYFYAALRNWRGPPLAALATGVTFGLVHASATPAVYLVPLAFFGALLCMLYERTGSLWPGIALHAVNNALAFGGDEHWGWEIPVLIAVALGLIWLLARALARGRLA